MKHLRKDGKSLIKILGRLKINIQILVLNLSYVSVRDVDMFCEFWYAIFLASTFPNQSLVYLSV